MDPDEARIVASIKGYHNLARTVDNRSRIIADVNFQKMAAQLVLDKRPRVVTRITAVLLTLTEREEEAVMLQNAEKLREAIGVASEEVKNPRLIHNLLMLSTRIKVSRQQPSTNTMYPQRPARRFVNNKSQQLSFIVHGLDDDLRMNIEKKCLSTRGVISVQFDMERFLVQLRITLILSPQLIVNNLFDAGAEQVERLLRNENGEMEKWHVEREHIMAHVLPDYIEEVDPSKEKASIVPTGTGPEGGGWFSSITSRIFSW